MTTRNARIIVAGILLLVGYLLVRLMGAGSVATVPMETETPAGGSAPQGFDIITLLPKDGIPAIYHPTFVQGAEADAQYGDQELVLGVEIEADARAYSIPFLSGHEIVDDVVGGVPVAVTW